MEKTFIFPKDVNGWLTYGEGRILFRLTQKSPHLGCVVELGSFFGRSTICLAQGSKIVQGGKVFTVDKFIGGESIGPYPDFYDKFLKNLKRYKLEDSVVAFRGETDKVVKDWSRPIRLLFIDASHFYKDVSLDFHLWEKYLVPGGIVVFHDSVDWPGVNRLVSEIIISGRFRDFKTYAGPLSPITGITYAFKNGEGTNTPYFKRFQEFLEFKILSLPKIKDRIKQTVKERGEKDIWFQILGRLANLWKGLRKD